MNKTYLANLPSGIIAKIRYELKLSQKDLSTWQKYDNLRRFFASGKDVTKEDDDRLEELAATEVLPEFRALGLTFFDGRPINMCAIETSLHLTHGDFIAAQAEYAAFMVAMSCKYIKIRDYEHEQDLPF